MSSPTNFPFSGSLDGQSIKIDEGYFSAKVSQPEIPPQQSPVVAPTAEEQVIAKLSAIPLLSEIKSVASRAKLSPVEVTKLNALRCALPSEMQNQFYGLSSEGASWRKAVNDLLTDLGMEASQDLGGHGGTFKAKVTIDFEGTPKTHYLFMKPKDPVESLNYEIINKIDSKLASFMPKIYGEVTIGPQVFIVMENTRLSDKGPLDQLVDIKLAGKFLDQNGELIFNPIADRNEINATKELRKKDKSLLDFWQMGRSVKKAPDYMIVDDSGMGRFFNYDKSESNLIKSLADANISDEHLVTLKNELKRIKKTLNESPVALIGASIIFVKQDDGSIKPILIDPAHMQVQVNEDEKESLKGQDGIYFGSLKQFNLQKLSNIKAMDSLLLSLEDKLSSHIAAKRMQVAAAEAQHVTQKVTPSPASLAGLAARVERSVAAMIATHGKR